MASVWAPTVPSPSTSSLDRDRRSRPERAASSLAAVGFAGDGLSIGIALGRRGAADRERRRSPRRCWRRRAHQLADTTRSPIERGSGEVCRARALLLRCPRAEDTHRPSKRLSSSSPPPRSPSPRLAGRVARSRDGDASAHPGRTAARGAAALDRRARRPPAAAPKLPDLARAGSDIVSGFVPPTEGWNYERRTAMIPMRDGVRLYTVIDRAQAAHRPDADRPHAHALRRRCGDLARRQPRRRDDAGRRRRAPAAQRLRARLPGRARHPSVRGRLRDDPAAARPAQLGEGRSRHRYLGHHRLAGEERSGQQRQGRDHRRLLRRLPHARGADRSASGARRRGADERDGRGLDRRRLVPQRRVPPDHGRVRLRADHRQGGRPQAALRLPRPLPGVPRRRLGRRVRAQERSRSPAGLAPLGRASRLHRLLEAPGGRPGAAEGDAHGADAPRARPLRSGGHLRPILAYSALERKDTANARNYIVLGPWHHGQQTREASSLGPLQLGRRHRPLLPRRGAAAVLGRAPQGGAGQGGPRRRCWRSIPATIAGGEFDVWPPKAIEHRKLYLQPSGGLAFTTPTAAAAADASTAFVSDPAKPVPYRVPPIRPLWAEDSTWRRWLVDDQRPFAIRPDVLVFESEPLDRAADPARRSGGRPLRLDHRRRRRLGGEADRRLSRPRCARSRSWAATSSWSRPTSCAAATTAGSTGREPVEPGAVVEYRFRMPHASHTFLPGHRIMVQVQSSWFPLYDRNPQTWVENIAFARPEDYRAATHRVHHAASAASFVELPVSRVEVAALARASATSPLNRGCPPGARRRRAGPSASRSSAPAPTSHSLGRSGWRRLGLGSAAASSAACRRVRLAGDLCEVDVGGGGDAVEVGAHLGDVEIDLEDPPLRPQQLDRRREIGLDPLADQAASGPQEQVLRHLLRDGRSAAHARAGDRARPPRPGSTRRRTRDGCGKSWSSAATTASGIDGSDVLEVGPAVVDAPRARDLRSRRRSAARSARSIMNALVGGSIQRRPTTATSGEQQCTRRRTIRAIASDGPRQPAGASRSFLGFRARAPAAVVTLVPRAPTRARPAGSARTPRSPSPPRRCTSRRRAGSRGRA